MSIEPSLEIKMKPSTVQYKGLTQLEHVLKRPGMYIGTTTLEDYTGFMVNHNVTQSETSVTISDTSATPSETSETSSITIESSETSEASVTPKSRAKPKAKPGYTFEYTKYKMVPGLLKLFNESLDNAKDNISRSLEQGTPQKYIKVNQNEYTIEIINDGHVVPVVKNENQVWIPSLVFGTLLSGSNYNDETDSRTGIGTNGLGIKLVVIYSTQFELEVKDPVNKKHFVQTWSNNMSTVGKPKVTSCNSKTGFVRIKYTLDVSKFKHLCEQSVWQRCIETQVVFTSFLFENVKVYYNGALIPGNAKNFFKSFDPDVHVAVLPNFVIGIGRTFTPGSMTMVSFVNGTQCNRGGKHMDTFATKIAKAMCEAIKRKTKKVVQPSFVKNYICLYCIATVINPEFDSQTKEYAVFDTAKTPIPDIPETLLRKVTSGSIMDSILDDLSAKDNSKLDKLSTIVSKVRIDKYTHANLAGKMPQKCTLFITEGDSANGMCRRGIESLKNGHDLYGAFPIRGKILNVREVSKTSLLANKEIENIVKILGLQMNCSYTCDKDRVFTASNGVKLRYSTLAVMSDQDTDGFHIKGLILNFIGYFWPSLLELGFVKTFITPIVKVLKPSKQLVELCTKRKLGRVTNDAIVFFSLPDIQHFGQLTDLTKLKLKYYKGLGTSNKAETEEYFSNLGIHIIKYSPATPDDFEVVDMAFNKKRSDDRKSWILGTLIGEAQDPDYTVDQSIHNFVRDELSQYSKDNLERSIPMITDGLKPSQRKIVYTAFKRNLVDKDHEVRVSQFAGAISELTMYHHGEASLQGAIVNMAQHFVGANNVPILVDDGIFGSRDKGGADSAAPRYIQTYLSPAALKLFDKRDNAILTQLVDEGQAIEPETYAPVLPLILVNGSNGIGTGWSTSIPCYNVGDIKDYIKAYLDNKPKPKVNISYNGFKGTITEHKGYFETTGIIVETKKGYDITELPLQVWTEDYKGFLNKLIEKSMIKDYEEHHIKEDLHFVISVTPSQKQRITDPIEFFHLRNKFSTSNMTCWLPNHKIQVFKSVYSILDTWIPWRLEMYTKRKQAIVQTLSVENTRLANVIRFIRSVIDKKLVVFERKVQAVIDDLVKLKFTKFNDSYDYLLSLKVQVFTEEQIQKLQREYDLNSKELNRVTKQTTSSMFADDLNHL